MHGGAMKDLSESKRYRLSRLSRIIAGRRYRAFQALALSTVAGLAIAGMAARAHNRDTTVNSRTIASPVAPLTAGDSSAAASTRAWKGPVSGSRSPAAQGGPNPKLTNVAHIAISPLGFDSKVITMPHAPFFLLVENRSGVGGVSLRVDRIDGASGNIRAKNVSREELDWSDFFDLPPGNYLLSEAGHPDWQCRITVNP
jgi:hypothetical protein